ncbi:gag/pol/env polyprotein, putative [Perkinsus marinus ATCC 50983]|uniref:Gag/pol/env polyprotein, putative n=1 Tax=Perkinsus marinus (strain ATCC 50983 / TXsc) TaxID=423536 RepID=C5KSQ2_PERM5|nr:gag/pol/env polyprotein, putative [Perkinsus marinus ATCC 50983]EER12495.1 gag/pol/env polyprotein, putative [Perkinsus marinus ATCC 50983]|eukprot:XP_002780700.1 gag/pol/env polyprotein, putative [Perkinsus marinus ATCC 50983]
MIGNISTMHTKSGMDHLVPSHIELDVSGTGAIGVVRIVGIDVDSVDDVKTTPRHQVVIHNDELKKKLIAKAHAVGHRGRVGTLKLLKQRYFWHGIARDCRRYVDACERCQFARADRVQRQSMGSIPWPGAIGCLRVCAVDMTGPYRVCSGASGSTSANPSSEDPDGQNYGLVVIDMATNYLRATTCKSKLASEVIRKLEVLFHSSDWPQILLVAQDSSLVSSAFRYFCDRHSICLKVLPRDSPALAGASERPHKDLHAYINKCVQFDDPDNADFTSWTIPFYRAIRAWNITPFTTDDDLSPHALCWYTNPRIPELDPREDDLLGENYHENLPPEAPLFDDSNELINEMKARQVTKWKRWTSIWCDLREKVRMATLSRRRLFDLRPGQKVLLWTRKPGKFIGWSWEGPYPVVETRGSVTTIRRNDVDFKAATTNLKPFHEYDDGDDGVCPDDVVEEPPQPDANDSPGTDSPQITTSPTNAPTGDIEEHTSQ